MKNKKVMKRVLVIAIVAAVAAGGDVFPLPGPVSRQPAGEKAHVPGQPGSGAGGGRERDPGLVAAAGRGGGQGQAGRPARPDSGPAADPRLSQGSPAAARV